VTSPDFTPSGLAALFARVERDLASAEPSATLDAITAFARDMVPGCQMASVSVGRGGRFSTPSATEETVLRVDDIQYELGSGPCVDAIQTDTIFNVADLQTDKRWPTFARRAHETHGIVSVLSIRLYVEDDVDLVAGLNMYSRELSAFGEASELVGVLLATHGALAMANASARDKVENLNAALKTSRDIGVAMGVLMATYKVTRDEAFNLLRLASHGLHRKLADVAITVADTGELPEIAARKP